MEDGFSYLLFAFAALLFLYGLVLWASGDYKMIPRWEARSVPASKAYGRRLGLIVMLCAAAPAVAGAAGLIFGPLAAAIVLIVGMVLCIWAATKLIKSVQK